MILLLAAFPMNNKNQQNNLLALAYNRLNSKFKINCKMVWDACVTEYLKIFHPDGIVDKLINKQIVNN